MNEYIVEVFNGNNVTHVVSVEQQNRKKVNVVHASESAYKYATKFRSKAIAQKVADQVNGAKVSPWYGIVPMGTKDSVAPKQSKINGHSAYRTI